MIAPEKDARDTVTGPLVRVVRLEHFRNYASAEVEVDRSMNVFFGPNGQGKTSLLEALHLISTSKLLRGSRDGEAVRSGEARAMVEVELDTSGTVLGISLAAGVRKRATLNGMSLPRAADVIGRLPSVCFSSADLPIVSGQPADRRMFLDLELCQLFPAYMRALTVYKRALEQRNALLRASQETPQPASVFEAWEAELAMHGAILREHRSTFVSTLAPIAAGHYADLARADELTLELQPADVAETSEQLFERLGATRIADTHRGSTSVGPHRDEMIIRLEDREARHYGSQGQQRSAVIALKLAVLTIFAERHGHPPLLLLDDIFSDLDKFRRQRLIEGVVASAGQVVLTCTEREQAGEEIASRARHFEIRAGTVHPA